MPFLILTISPNGIGYFGIFGVKKYIHQKRIFCYIFITLHLLGIQPLLEGMAHRPGLFLTPAESFSQGFLPFLAKKSALNAFLDATF